MKHYITSIKIKLPWCLRWLKKYVKLEVERWDFPQTLKGQSFDLIIVDEFTNGEFKNE